MSQENMLLPDQSLTSIKAQDAEKKEIAEAYFEVMIMNARKFNEGNNGVICEINLAALPPELKSYIQGQNIQKFSAGDENDPIAMKILKVYESGHGSKEFAMQKKIFDLVQSANDPDMAKVPEPLLFKEISIKDHETMIMLSGWGVRLPSIELPEDLSQKWGMGKFSRAADLTIDQYNELVSAGTIIPDVKIEIILMEKLSGKDLARVIYEEVAELRDDIKDYLGPNSKVEDLNFTDLSQLVSRSLGFAKPGQKHFNQGLRNFENEAVNWSNVEILVKFLERANCRLNPEWFSKLKKFIDLIHKMVLSIMICMNATWLSGMMEGCV